MSAPPGSHLLAHDPRSWLEGHVSTVTCIVSRVAARRRLPWQDQQELLSLVWTHLTRHDYRVLRTYRGTSAVTTYLQAVVERQVMDMRARQWGKWRPSATARRLGTDAMLFERLVVRDGQPPADAARWMQSTGHAAPAAAAVLAARRRPARRFVGLEALTERPSPAADPFTTLVDRHRRRHGVRVGHHLAQALRALPPDDRQLLQLRHERGLRVSQMAAELQVDAKPLYRRLARIHGQLRAALGEAGVSAADAREVTAGTCSHVPRVLRQNA